MVNIRKWLGYLLILIGIGSAVYVVVKNSNIGKKTEPFSAYNLITASWLNYKNKFITAEGRVVDFSENDGITTSEGQSYAMLRAVIIDDKETFDRVWKWTKENLDRKDDNLLAWKWGKSENGEWKIMGNGGENSAADADEDVALALIAAQRRWGDENYLNEAKPILKDLWQINSREIQGKRYIIAGNWAAENEWVVINPSYFAPYAWRIFAEVDTERDWKSLIDPAYEMLNRLGKENLDKNKTVGLPPDWVEVNTQTGEIRASNKNNLTTNYSFDAMRVPFRVAVDYLINKDEKAKEYLKNNFEFLKNEYETKGKLATGYAHDGTVVRDFESAVMYGTSLGYFRVIYPELAQKMYDEKVLLQYSNDNYEFNKELSYYDQNLLWFGAMYFNEYEKRMEGR